MPMLLVESDAYPDGEFLPGVLLADETFIRALFSLATTRSLKRNPGDVDQYVAAWARDGEPDDDEVEPVFFDLCVPKTRVGILRGILESLVGNTVGLPHALHVELCDVIAVLQASADAAVDVFFTDVE